MHIPPTLLLEEKLLFSGIPLGYPSVNQGFIDFYWNELNLVQRMCRKENATCNLNQIISLGTDKIQSIRLFYLWQMCATVHTLPVSYNMENMYTNA